MTKTGVGQVNFAEKQEDIEKVMDETGCDEGTAIVTLRARRGDARILGAVEIASRGAKRVVFTAMKDHIRDVMTELDCREDLAILVWKLRSRDPRFLKAIEIVGLQALSPEGSVAQALDQAVHTQDRLAKERAQELEAKAKELDAEREIELQEHRARAAQEAELKRADDEMRRELARLGFAPLESETDKKLKALALQALEQAQKTESLIETKLEAFRDALKRNLSPQTIESEEPILIPVGKRPVHIVLTIEGA